MNTRAVNGTIGRALLNVLIWLEDGGETMRWWKAQTELVHLCLSDLSQLDNENSATVELQAMLLAMHGRDRLTALTHGTAALALLA